MSSFNQTTQNVSIFESENPKQLKPLVSKSAVIGSKPKRESMPEPTFEDEISANPIPENIHENKEADIFFRFPLEALSSGHRTLKLNVVDSQDIDEDKGTVIKEIDVKLVGPFK